MNKRQEYDNPRRGHVLLFAGPNGAGKDTIEAQFTDRHADATRIVRHITRPAAPTEVEGEDYHFVTESHFENMIGEDAFIEYAQYIGMRSGTSNAELDRAVRRARFANITANFEDGLTLYRKLGERGLSRVCFFISPVAYDVFNDDPDEYLAALRRRMSNRGRASDLVEARLVKAAQYRDLYLTRQEDVTYINNSDGQLEEAGRTIDHVAEALVISAPNEVPAPIVS